MKTLLIFFICAGVCHGEVEDKGNIYDEDNDEAYIGNPDDFAIIERPCQVYDLSCIRKFFANHAKCTIANPNKKIPDPFFRSQYTAYFSDSNITAIINNQQVRGLNTTSVEEFYINKATNKVVFAINVRNLTQSSPALFFNFQRNGREPIVVLYQNPPQSANIEYPSVTFTAVIPNIKDMQLDKAEVTAFADSAPQFQIAPRSNVDPDPTVMAEQQRFSSNMATVVQEIMLTDAPFYPPYYIQHNICDFGLKVL